MYSFAHKVFCLFVFGSETAQTIVQKIGSRNMGSLDYNLNGTYYAFNF